MLCISCLTLNLPSNEQRKSQINCPLFFFFPSSPLLGKGERNYRKANRLVYEFLWGRHQRAIQYESPRVRMGVGGVFFVLYLHQTAV